VLALFKSNISAFCLSVYMVSGSDYVKRLNAGVMGEVDQNGFYRALGRYVPVVPQWLHDAGRRLNT